MAAPAWNVSGQYHGDVQLRLRLPLRPRATGRAADPRRLPVRDGVSDRTRLIRGRARWPRLHLLGLTPEEMGKGNWSVGLVTDARASAEQRDAMTAIASGPGRWPDGRGFPGLIGKFLGVESAPIAFDRDGAQWSVKASEFVDMAATGAKGLNPDAELRLQNTGHPAADSFTLAHASKSHVHALGLAVGRREREEQRQTRPLPGRAPEAS